MGVGVGSAVEGRGGDFAVHRVAVVAGVGALVLEGAPLWWRRSSQAVGE